LVGARINPVDGQLFDPKDDQNWPPVNFTFKVFLQRLMGIGIPFESAQIARQALLKLPPEAPIVYPVVQAVSEEEEIVKLFAFFGFFLGILVSACLGC
jgi:hypothetical protein